MPSKSNVDIRGDFQTPLQLAKKVWQQIGDVTDLGAVLEPTVGVGAFLESAPDLLRKRPWFCFDIEPGHTAATRLVAEKQGFTKAQITVADAFQLSPGSLGDIDVSVPILAIGNPPWVTTADQGGLTAQNLPVKTNTAAGLQGLDAITGKSNFDIAEAILLRLIDTLDEFHDIRIAFLIKRSVAMRLCRRFLGYAQELSFSRIDARRHFGVSVDAGLFIMRRQLEAQSVATHVDVSDHLGAKPTTRAGFQNERFVEDIDAYASASCFEAAQAVPWRQGIKHDVSKILELRPTENGLINGLGEQVDVEEEALWPLYKSSDLANDRPPGRLFPLYQRDLSGPSPELLYGLPRLNKYLQRHQSAFLARRSRIYADKYPFALFGIGPYTCAPWKVAISGMYASANFRVLGPSENGSPALVDDTCYLLPFQTEHDARQVAAHLNSAGPQQLLCALMDRRAKRPVTKALLARIDVPLARIIHQASASNASA